MKESMEPITMSRLYKFFRQLVSKKATKASEPLSPDDFTSAFAEALQRALPKETIERRATLELGLTNSEGGKQTFFLYNAYSVYRNEQCDVKDVIDSYVRSFTADDPEEQIERNQIVPVLKDRAWLAEMQRDIHQTGTDKSLEHVWADYNEELVVVYAADLPHTTRYFSEDVLEELGLNPFELREIGRENLGRLMQKIQIDGGAGLYVLSAGGVYESSLLLFDELWEDPKPKIDGRPVVSIPARGVLILTGDEDSEGLAKMKSIAKEAYEESPYRLTDKLFVYVGGKFEVFNE